MESPRRLSVFEPLHGLAGDVCDELEVTVKMQDRQSRHLGGRSDELWYMLSYPDMASRDASWAAFAADPAWQQARAESEADGPLLDHLENRILAPTDFSPLG